MEKIYNQLSVERPSSLKIKSKLLLIFEAWSTAAKKRGNTGSRHYASILPAVEMLEKAEGVSYSVNELAAACHVCQSLFRKRFHQCFGMSPKEYSLNLQIDKAKKMLLKEGLSVSLICDVLGFSSPAYFSRIFKRKTGMTPREYAIHGE